MNAVTDEILERFSKSWIETRLFFNNLVDDNPALNRLIPLSLHIGKLKKLGEDKNFRLSNIKDALVFSRSAEPRLLPLQKFITVEALDKSFVITLKDSKKMYRQYTIKDLDDELLTGLLQTLKQELVD